jgi:hypothetical protein
MLLRQLSAFVCFCMVSASLHAAELGDTKVAQWKGDRRAPLVLMFDDSMPSHVKTVLPELMKRKLVGTFYVNPGSGHFGAQRAIWERELLTNGMVLANHTFTHKGARDVANCEEEITKCNEVLDAIATAARGRPDTLISFGRPGVPQGAWNVTDEELAELLAANRLILRPNVLFAQIHMKDAKSMIARVEKALATGKPDAVAFHGVGGEWLSIDVPAFLALLDFIDTKRDELWVTDPISIHKYETERDGAQVEVAGSGPTEIRLRLKTKADPKLYDAPFTLITEVPNLWANVEITQGANKTTVKAVDGKVTYDARPGEEVIVLRPR